MNQPQTPPPQLQIEEVHLTDYLNVIMRRRRIFLLSFFALFFGVALYTFMMKPIYEANATLHVKDDKKGGKSGVLGDLALLNSANPVDSEIEILKSRTNAAEVVKRLHLNWNISKKHKDLEFKIVEFESSLKKPEYTIELTGADTYIVRPLDGPSLPGRNGQLLKTDTLTILIKDIKGNAGDSFKLKLLPINRAAEGLRKRFKVSEVGKKTNIIKVSYNDTNPTKARDIVNTLVQAYLDQTISFKTEEASRTVSFVEEQLQGTRKDLDESEKNLQAYKTNSGVVKLDAEAQELIKKLSDIEKERASVSLQRKQVEFALTSLQDARRKGVVYSPAVFKEDALIGNMANRLTELEVQRRALISENTESHPQVKAIMGQIDQIQKKIQSTYETYKLNLTKQESTIQLQLDQYEGKLRKLPEAERDLARLLRFSKVNADIYMFLLQKHEEARIVKASTISNINVVDPAITPDLPVKPQKKKNLMLGLLVGLMFGVGAAFFMDYLDDTIKDEEEAKKALGWPHLAMIPGIESSAVVGEPTTRSSRLVVQSKPKSPVAEAFRGLRTAIHFSSLRRNTKVVMITSSFPGEGKSTIAANLALTFAQAGNRVILVDCDLRRPSMNTIFDKPRNPGITEVLAGDVSLEEALHSTDVENISLLTAGTIPPNPAELLCSDSMRDLLAGLRESYDMVILDAPPVIPVTDAPLLTAFTDMVVVVIESGRIPLKAAQRMKELLQSVQAPVAGFVINDRTSLFSDTYGYYGKGYYGKGYYGRRYYGYAYYGADDQKEAPKKSWWRKILR